MRDPDMTAKAVRSDVAGANYTASRHAAAWAAFARDAESVLQDFESALEHPADVQRQQLRRIVSANADTDFGRAHNFAEVESAEDYQRQVPIADWADLAPLTERMKAGEARVLTFEDAFHFERTSGSGAQSKDVPYTAALMQEFQRALVVWLASLLRDCPAVAGPSYWSLSPDPAPPEITPAGVTIGSAGDAAYLANSAVENLLPTVIGAGAFGADAADSEEWRVRTLGCLADEADLRMLSVWSPTFLMTILSTVLDEATRGAVLDRLRQGLSTDRFKMLCLAAERRNFSLLWPQLAVISCWADGPSESYAARLGELFPGCPVVPKGLFATEGVVSTSWGVGNLRPVALASHFLEFVDDDGTPHLVDDVILGERYRPLLTTAGGLYRYRLGDIVEVDGFLAGTPCLRFIGREDHRSDLVGEKLDEAIVAVAFREAGVDASSVLVPDTSVQPARYRLITQSSDCAAGQRVEDALNKVHHYALARRNGQLGSVACCYVKSLSEILHDAWEAAGKRSGDAKATRLVATADYAATLVAALQTSNSKRA